MATVDLSNIVTLTNQISALQQQAAVATDPTVKGFITSQIAVAESQLQAEAQRQQNQVDASNNLLDGLGLFATLNNTVGSLAPSIVSLFKK